jgi:hypothetical protein
MGLSPFAFEKDLNIQFRKVLEGQSPTNFRTTDNGIMAASPQHDHHDASQDEYPSTTSSIPYCSLIHRASAAETPTPSSPSTEISNTWSDTSYSPTSDTSVDFTNTPLSSASSTLSSTSSGHHCPVCVESFRLKGELRKHWYRKHEKRFLCAVPGCDMAFHLKADLTRHTGSRHKDDTIILCIPCEHFGCLATFSRRDNMLRHKRIEHENGKRKVRGRK